MNTVFKSFFSIAVACVMCAMLCIVSFGCSKSHPSEDAEPSSTIEAATSASASPTEIPTPTPIPTPGPEEYCFARSMARMRIVKNRFYNLLDEAFSENSEMSGYLYLMLDFVYGDSALDMFTECGRDNEAFTLSLTENGYASPIISEDGGTVTVSTLDSDGTEYIMIAKYDKPSDSGCIEIYMDEDILLSIEWVETVDGYALQYAAAETDENGVVPNKYNGYRAYLFENGDGFVSFGSFCEGDIVHIYADPDSIDTSWNYKNMYTFNLYKLLNGVLTARISGKTYTHIVGSSPKPDFPNDFGYTDNEDTSDDETP